MGRRSRTPAASRLALPLVFLALAACGEDGGRVERAQLSRVVLQPEDLAETFVPSGDGPRSDSGWESRFRDRATSVASRAELFPSSSLAEDDLYAALEEARAGPWQPIDDPGLGGESFAATRLQRPVRIFRVLWHDANVVAELRVTGPDGLLALSGVLELARKQERRIDDAAG